MVDDVSLRQYFDQRLDTYQTSHQQIHDLMDVALDKAAEAVNQRLGTMNELRDQINRERGVYVTIEVLDARLAMVTAQLDAIRQEVASQNESSRREIGLLKNTIANMEGRAWALAVAFPLVISALVSMTIKFL